MSFQDVARPRPQTSNPRAEGGTGVLPRVIVGTPSSPLSSPSRTKQKNKKTRPLVFHGRVQHVVIPENDDDNKDAQSGSSSFSPSHQAAQAAVEAEDRFSVRRMMERRSTFAQLSLEVQHFSKIVANLEAILASSGETPEAAWRAQILIRSAQETDKDLWNKLYAYEKTLVVCCDTTDNQQQNANTGIIRTEQSACLKLHRDFKRVHKALVMALSLYEKQQRAEVSRLGAANVGWSGPQPQQQNDQEEDFFDRAMRERQAELEKINADMHRVNYIYNDLAALVHDQQQDLNVLEETVMDAKVQTEQAADHIHCAYTTRDRYCGALDDDNDDWRDSFNFDCSKVSPCNVNDFLSDNNSLTRDEEEQHPLEVSIDDGDSIIEVVEVPREAPAQRTSCCKSSQSSSDSNASFMSFEAVAQDMMSIHQDIVEFGKDIWSKSKQLECGDIATMLDGENREEQVAANPNNA